MKYLLGAIKFFVTVLLVCACESTYAQSSSLAIAKDMTKVIEKMKWSNRCGNFVNQNGFGSLSNHILRTMSRTKYPELYRGTADINKSCPNFNNLRDSEKEYVWVMLLTSMSFFESTCNPSARGVGPNGIALGLLQLHLNRERYYADGCENGDSMRENLSLSCGLSMINNQLRKEQKLFSQSSYWEVLRPISPSDKAKNIAWSLMLFSLCQKN